MPQLRLLADDITGALDSAAAFAPVLGPVVTIWAAPDDVDARDHTSLALDSGTREAKRGDAVAKVAGMAHLIAPSPGRLSFFKVDSLLRGHAGAELAAILATVPFGAVVIAPAIPFQNRRSRNGRQQRLEPGGWVNTGEDIIATLNAAGHVVAVKQAQDPVPDGISFWDVADDAELDAIAAATIARAGVLYVGAAGLAGALARTLGTAQPPSLPPLPLLGLIGTDHPAMAAQLAAIGGDHLRLGDKPAAALHEIVSRLRERRAVFVSCDLPGTGREAARAEITRRFAALCRDLPRPPALFVSGGETLASLCRDLGATSLDVVGEFEPGLPLSTLRGGAWDGIAIISKSGAFGAPDVMSRLVAALGASQAKATV